MGPSGHGVRIGVELGFATPGEIAEHLHDCIADEADADGGEAVTKWREVRRWWRSAHTLTEENRHREDASGGETRMFHGDEWMWPNANSPRAPGKNRRAVGNRAGLVGSDGQSRFVFELARRAGGELDVITRSLIDGLVNAAALREGVEVAHLHDVTRCGNCVIGWDGDIARWPGGMAFDQA